VEEKKPYEPLNPNHPRLAIKHGGAFLLTDMEGMMPGDVAQGFGFYEEDTRWLRRWEFTLGGKPLFMLNSDVAPGYAARFVYTNAKGDLPSQSLMIARDLVINDGLTERLVIKNFAATEAELELVLHFDSDFVDMFEVRGEQRPRRGNLLVPTRKPDRKRVKLAYDGLDGVRRETFIDFLRGRPDELSDSRAVYRLKLKRHQSKELLFHISTRLGGGVGEPAKPRVTFNQERAIAQACYEGWLESNAHITTGNPEFNAALQRGYNDIYLLRQGNKFGISLAAGVPWFAVPFGRDNFVTALQTVAFMPELAREILSFFTHYQGKKQDELLCEEPGKMPHEIRSGEMAHCKEIVFRPYYGTVDATQLWLMLLSAYVSHTGDLAFAREVWENVEAAERFLNSATLSGKAYITYGGKSQLANQGWKDSWNCIVHSDGSLAKAPIAVCEAQGYLYAAWEGTAKLARLLGKEAYAIELQARATLLKQRFQKDFWMGDKQFVALALDGDGRQCAVISSNPGHLLGTGILEREQELIVADRMMKEDMFSGWGFRTLSSDEVAYQPLDYQLGSVWPHDSGYAAANMVAIGRASNAHAVLEGLLAAASQRPDYRLPELFCGFPRNGTGEPVRYPVACVPQAWAAGCWFHFLSGCMNIRADAVNNRLTIAKPSLPSWLGKVTVCGLRLGETEFDLEFAPDGNGKTKCRVTSVSGDATCVIEE
jgi:glycogen debranching enzyme